MDYATAYDVGDRKRDRGINEDSVAVSVFEDGHRSGTGGENASASEATRPRNRSVATFALADGAGGYEAGDVASYIASTVVPERLADLAIRAARSDPAAFDVDLGDVAPAQPSPAAIRRAIVDAVQAAHRAVLGYVNDAGQPAFTTVVAGVAVGGELHYGWVGDSRLYVVNGEHGTIERLTRDHSVVAELRAAGEIDEVEAHVHPRGNEITDALGGHPGTGPGDDRVAVETHTVPLYAEDVVFATSDGIVDAQTDAPSLHDRYLAADRPEEAGDAIREAVVTDDDLRDHLLAADSLDGAARGLVDLANDRGGKDNVSAVLCRDPTLASTPPADDMPTREPEHDGSVAERQTVILPDE